MSSLDYKLVPPRSLKVLPHSLKLGQAMSKRFIQTAVIDNLGETSTLPAMMLWDCSMVSYHIRTQCTFSVLWLVKVTFLMISNFKCLDYYDSQ
jgi:hypothetical protein